jgi:hypothetical protein
MKSLPTQAQCGAAANAKPKAAHPMCRSIAKAGELRFPAFAVKNTCNMLLPLASQPFGLSAR